jgi:hypothetical protein
MKNSGGRATKQENQRKSTKERRGGAKLAPFCRRVRSVCMKLSTKEVLKKPLRGYATKNLD